MSDKEYFDRVNDVANRAGDLGFWMIKFGNEPELISDRTHQLVRRSDNEFQFAGTVAEIATWLDGVEGVTYREYLNLLDNPAKQ